MTDDQHIPQQEQEQIERYLSGEMDPAEQEAFRTRLINDPLLQSRVNEIKLLSVGIQEVNLSSRLEEFHSNIPVTGRAKAEVYSMRKWMVAASSIIVIGLAALWFFTREKTNDKLYADYFQPDPGLLSAMSASSNYSFEKAMVDYKSGKYNEAISGWRQLLNNGAASDTLNYFMASAFLASDRSDSAIIYFDKVQTSQKSVFIAESYWYKGLALIKQGRITEAITSIEKSDRKEKEDLITQLKK